MPSARVGICSWTDRSLIASGFYPRGASTPAARLAYIAERFDVVEADAPFYAIPSAATAFRWVAGTPRSFRFGVKSFSLFTFHRARAKNLPTWLRAEIGASDDAALISRADVPHELRVRLFEQFAEPLKVLQGSGRLAYILFQFPPYFRYSRESMAYITRVREICGRMPVAVEVRDGSWLADGAREKFFAHLKHLNIAYTAVDEPKITGAATDHWPITAEWGTLARFHGRNERAWRDPHASVADRFDWDYSRDELEPWAARAKEAAAASSGQTYLMFNNCVGDKAVRAASMIAELIGVPTSSRQTELF